MVEVPDKVALRCANIDSSHQNGRVEFLTQFTTGTLPSDFNVFDIIFSGAFISCFSMMFRMSLISDLIRPDDSRCIDCTHVSCARSCRRRERMQAGISGVFRRYYYGVAQFLTQEFVYLLLCVCLCNILYRQYYTCHCQSLLIPNSSGPERGYFFAGGRERAQWRYCD